MTMRIAITLLAGLLLVGCSVFQSVKNAVVPPGKALKWDTVTFNMPPAINMNFPLAVDIVTIYEPALVDKILGMKAADWFAAKDSLLKTYPNALHSRSWELAPGESKTVPGKPFCEKQVFAVIGFADYFAQGEHRVRLDELEGRIRLEFEANDFSAGAQQK